MATTTATPCGFFRAASVRFTSLPNPDRSSIQDSQRYSTLVSEANSRMWSVGPGCASVLLYGVRLDGGGNSMSETTMEVEGSCLCGGSRYRVRGRCTGMVHCHCQRCRKAHGASLASWTHFDQATFVWLSRGEIAGYHSSPSIRRSFCTTCGSIIPNPIGARAQTSSALLVAQRAPDARAPGSHLPLLYRLASALDGDSRWRRSRARRSPTTSAIRRWKILIARSPRAKSAAAASAAR